MNKIKIYDLPITNNLTDDSKILLSKKTGTNVFTTLITYSSLFNEIKNSIYNKIENINSINDTDINNIKIIQKLEDSINDLKNKFYHLNDTYGLLLDEVKQSKQTLQQYILNITDTINTNNNNKIEELSIAFETSSNIFSNSIDNLNIAYEQMSSNINSTGNIEKIQTLTELQNIINSISVNLYDGWISLGFTNVAETGVLNMYNLTETFNDIYGFINISAIEDTFDEDEEVTLSDYIIGITNENTSSNEIITNIQKNVFAKFEFTQSANFSTSSTTILYTINIVKSGYIPIGIISLSINNTSAKIIGSYYTNNKLYVYVQSGNITKTTAIIVNAIILYQKTKITLNSIT